MNLFRFLSFLLLILQSEAIYSQHYQGQQKQSKMPVSKSQLVRYTWKSKRLNNKRDVWVYTPTKDLDKTKVYPLLIVFDGQAYVSELIPTPSILDRLIARKTIPPIVAVFISSIDQPSRNRELPCYDPFVDFLAKEILPWVRKHYPVSQQPQNTIVAGSSFGGLAAAYAALKHPELFGKVLSQSGAFWWKPKQGPREWLIQQYAQAGHLPICFYLDVGNQETDSNGGEPSMIDLNRKMRDLLRHNGHQVHYVEFNGGHEYEAWRDAFPNALTLLLSS